MHEGQVIPIEGVPCKPLIPRGGRYVRRRDSVRDHERPQLEAGRSSGLARGLARVVAQMGARLQRRFTPAEVKELIGAVGK